MLKNSAGKPDGLWTILVIQTLGLFALVFYILQSTETTPELLTGLADVIQAAAFPWAANGGAYAWRRRQQINMPLAMGAESDEPT